MPKMASDLSWGAFRLYGRCFVRCFLSVVGVITVEVGGVGVGVVRMGIMMEGKMVGDFHGMEKFRICERGRRRSWIFILIITISEVELDPEELQQQEEEWVNPL